MEIIIRKMNLEDFEKIRANLKSDFDDFWNEHVFEKELQNEYSTYFVGLDGESIVGFAGVWQSVDVMHVTNIVVRKDMRNRKIGMKLLDKLISYAEEKNMEGITLEVNEENIIAQKLYKRFEFIEVGIRKKYYDDKNGIIFTKILKTEVTNEK